MTCAEFQKVLPYIIETGGNAAEDQHLRGCPVCSDLVQDLRYIAEQAKLLVPMEDPSPRVWNGIRQSLEREGMIKPARARGRLLGPIPWMAALGAMILGSFGAFLVERGRQQPGAQLEEEPPVVRAVSLNTIATEQDDDQLLLHLAAAVERESEHPLAQAIVNAAKELALELPRAESFEAVAGHGVIATIEGHRLAIGNARLLEREHVALDGLSARAAELAGEGQTVVRVARDGQAIGVVAIADAPRKTAAAAIAALKEIGIRPVMLTGDNRQTAERIAAQLGLDEVIAEVLPQDKALKVKGLQVQGRRVAMVGDGVNDAPALAQADVGIAIGAGTDVAIETADVVLMRSDPVDVATAVEIGRGTVRKMRQNLGWAIGYNSLALPIAAGVFEPFGFTLRPEIAAISMSGSSVLVAVNALALKSLRLPRG